MPRWFKFPSHHLGSTLAISCHKLTEQGCDDREVYRYYRYAAYGQMKVYDASGTTLATDDSAIDRMYTGQVWDDAAQMYYYNARFYDPKAARFLTMDPVREYACPYAYVRWNPTMLVDPTGMIFGLGAVTSGPYGEAGSGPGADKRIELEGWIRMLDFRGPGRGGSNGPSGTGFGAGGQGPLAAGLQALAKAAFSFVATKLAEAQGQPFNISLANPSPNSTPASPPGGYLQVPDFSDVSLLSLWQGPLGDYSRGLATQIGGYVDVSVTAPISRFFGLVAGI